MSTKLVQHCSGLDVRCPLQVMHANICSWLVGLFGEAVEPLCDRASSDEAACCEEALRYRAGFWSFLCFLFHGKSYLEAATARESPVLWFSHRDRLYTFTQWAKRNPSFLRLLCEQEEKQPIPHPALLITLIEHTDFMRSL